MERRNTIQKEMVLDAVRSLANHPTADEVYECVQKKHRAVGKGTVYRNLNVLAEEGKLRKIEMADGADRFDHTCMEHYHVKCICCGAVTDVDMANVPDLLADINNTSGMQFLSFDILFKGICQDCQKNKKTKEIKNGKQ